MNNTEITRGLLRISNILNLKRTDYTREEYRSRMNAARETAGTMLAMLGEPASAPVGTLTVVEVPADDEITRLLKEMLASFGIGEKEPEPKNCGNCGTSSYDGMNTYQCIHPETLKIIPLGSWTLPFQTCSGWTPRKEAANE